MNSNSKPGLLILIGIGFLAGAAVLAWFSAIATLQMRRTSATTVDVSIDSRIFGLLRVGHERIEDVRSVSLLRSRTPGSRSHTPDRLIFETPRQAVDTGRVQQLFAPDFGEIEAFVGDPAGHDVSFSSVGRSSELIRFVVAQLVVVFLAFCGGGLLWMAAKTIFG